MLYKHWNNKVKLMNLHGFVYFFRTTYDISISIILGMIKAHRYGLDISEFAVIENIILVKRYFKTAKLLFF